MHRFAGILLFFCLTLALLPGRSVLADPVRPFFTRNLQPVIQIFGLPPADDGLLAAPGTSHARLTAEAANHFAISRKGAESVEFDGETYRFTLALRAALGRDWELGIDLPLVTQDGGILDGFIENWHDAFGMSQGGRNRRERDRLFYFYQKVGETKLDVDHGSTGLGDISVLLARRIFAEQFGSERHLALRGGIKLPTGNSDRLHGSGSTDVHLRLAATDARTLRGIDTTLFASGGLLWLSPGDILSDQQRHWVWFGNAGLGWKPLGWMALKAQIDGHSAFFDGSDLRETGKPSAQLMVGGSLYFPGDWTLDLGIGEDIMVATAPDVVFHLALARRF
ncbi:DUF3187 family protein [Geoalkalibacter sp.]|uniref:DUF3187 family protein n=1 Tax=Geoalkalibacter sp. TaxID=3041440 RepID=UPI00272EAD35|nr:DUF3187 family protein [Geoalkalibacter sp.]